VEDGAKVGYVMEYCQNGNLYLICESHSMFFFNTTRQSHIKNGIVLSPVKMIEIACGLANILSILHDSCIAHRDIKSANVMVFSFTKFVFFVTSFFQLDQDFHPKLGDFGLSKMITTMQASATNLSGTPTHMAPEQFTPGAKHNPIKADIYSFGMLLYEIATNKVFV
jgi:serine/threonine protein kinase